MFAAFSSSFCMVASFLLSWISRKDCIRVFFCSEVPVIFLRLSAWLRITLDYEEFFIWPKIPRV